ncbi:MAG: YegS/Rv2252/BmrU family lipid kinase [Gammaproteobacteria bacterium]|nr:YegS/Rv2252/BmrU family lipid kinase [Gammaproteobacteria bacterium]
MRYVFIVNLEARDGELKHLWRAAEPSISAELGPLEVCYPQSALETLQQARTYADKGGYCIVSVGGEGTMNLVMQAIMDSDRREDTLMALVPFGNVNDYASALGMEKNWQSAIQALMHGQERRVGVTELLTQDSRNYALNMADIGFGASTAKLHSVDRKLSWVKGQLKYNLLAIRALMSWKNIPCTVQVDDEEIGGDVALVLAGNSPTLGGFRVLPHATVDSDKFAVTICRDVSRLQLMQVLDDSKKSRLTESERILFRHASRISVEPKGEFVTQVDGEITNLKANKVEFIAHAKALRFMAP